jgi:hypothetical protein
MSDDGILGFGLVVGAFLGAVGLACYLCAVDMTYADGRDKVRAEAVKQGVAEWVAKVDEEGNAAVEFVWKKP